MSPKLVHLHRLFAVRSHMFQINYKCRITTNRKLQTIMLSVLLVAVNLLNSVLAVEVVPASNLTKLAVNGSGLPDTAPYNFMFTPIERSEFEEDSFSRFVIPIDARHKKARLVYNNDSEIIGFDLYIRGRSNGMTPLFGLDRATAKSANPNFFLSFPMDSTAWKTTNIETNYKQQKFTSREKFMLNDNSDFYCRFRNPSGNYSEETEAVVSQLNKGKDLSFNGVTNITNFNITSNTKAEMLSKLLLKDSVGTVYLDAEYEDPLILKEDVNSESSLFVFLHVCASLIMFSYVCALTFILYIVENNPVPETWIILPVTTLWVFIWIFITCF